MRLEEGKEYLVCDYCKNIYSPAPNDRGVRVLGEPAGLSCPVSSGTPPSADPDLLAQLAWEYRQVVEFLLTHASELFRSEDQALLADLLARERKRSQESTTGFQSAAVVTPFYAIGRARLNER